MTDDIDARTFRELADHARIVQEEVAIAEGFGYIAAPNYSSAEHPATDHPSLPGFKGLGVGSANMAALGESYSWQSFNNACNHIRFLEHVVERLACQVAEMAERLDAESARFNFFDDGAMGIVRMEDGSWRTMHDQPSVERPVQVDVKRGDVTIYREAVNSRMVTGPWPDLMTWGGILGRLVNVSADGGRVTYEQVMEGGS
jgi:hypothetical protein